MTVTAYLQTCGPCVFMSPSTSVDLLMLHVPPPLHLCILTRFMMREHVFLHSSICVCVQGRPDWRLLIKRAIAAKVCLVINIGLSDSGEEPALLMCTAEINMSKAACLPKSSIFSALFGYDSISDNFLVFFFFLGLLVSLSRFCVTVQHLKHLSAAVLEEPWMKEMSIDRSYYVW